MREKWTLIGRTETIGAHLFGWNKDQLKEKNVEIFQTLINPHHYLNFLLDAPIRPKR